MAKGWGGMMASLLLCLPGQLQPHFTLKLHQGAVTWPSRDSLYTHFGMFVRNTVVTSLLIDYSACLGLYFVLGITTLKKMIYIYIIICYLYTNQCINYCHSVIVLLWNFVLFLHKMEEYKASFALTEFALVFPVSLSSLLRAGLLKAHPFHSQHWSHRIFWSSSVYSQCCGQCITFTSLHIIPLIQLCTP